jgi:hypothetical protein
LPAGSASREARVQIDTEATLGELHSSGLVAEVEAIVRRFDWHSQVTIRFVEGQGRAGWNRSARTVTVHGEYIRRFVQQGESIARPR